MYRAGKVAEAIRREVGIIIQKELKDPRMGFVTVTRVEVTNDLRYAKVYFSTLGKKEDEQKSIDALNSASGYIKRLVSERVKLRLFPEMTFMIDRSAEYSIHIQDELDKIREQKQREIDELKKGERGDRKE
ncbi:MAG: 30S ribosome-binding factor RbfA [Candidatus Omnitrophica bacterium]|nr:30S ribosome-binding factor RbfA [Candidatus Omnitrophota bacterium]